MASTDDVVVKLDVLIRLVAVGLTQGKTRQDQILLLSKAGLSPKEIADLIGVSPNSISVTIYQSKRKPSRAKGSSKE